MNEITPFTLSINDLVNLGQDWAVEFFRRLLWAESARVGIGRHLIDVPQCINVADGGIDAYIEDVTPLIEDLIPSGVSGFQIKSSDLKPSECEKELHEKKDLKKPIKPEIERLLNKDGVYVLVLFAEITKVQRTRRERHLKRGFTNLGHETAKFRIYTANQIAGFAERFPTLVAWLKNERGQCLPYSVWSGNRDVKIPKEFVLDKAREEWIEQTRKMLRDTDGQCRIFRVVGPPGIGKTRLVFEALSPDDLKNHVIYVRADGFQQSTLHNALQTDQNLSATIVIDECNLEQHGQFVSSFYERGSRLAIFTISHEIGKVSQASMPVELSPLGRDEIEQIIKAQDPKLPINVISRLREFADGYPLIAVLLAESYTGTDATSNQFITLSDDGLMNRLIGGRMSVDSEHFRKTKRVLKALSLFQKIGFRGEPSREAEWLASHFNVHKSDFDEIVGEQKKRGIIQGNYYIYVRPFMLRVHLLEEWWEARGLKIENLKEFSECIPVEFRNELFHRFISNIPYVAVTERGREFAEKALSEEGIFSDGSVLKTQLGADLFLRLASVAPGSALKCLKRIIGSWSKDELLKFATGRREVLWALENIVKWKDLFADAAGLVLALAEAENETWSTNASGFFAQLFSLAPQATAPTEASPQERLPVLREALGSESKQRRLLALRACNQALESYHFTRTIGTQYQGLRKEPRLWAPETYEEWFSAYRQVWELLRDHLDSLPEDEQQEAIKIFLNRAQGLARIRDLCDMVIDTIDELAKRDYTDKKEILANVIRILRFGVKGMSTEVQERWERIETELTGSDFSSLMKRYIGMPVWTDTIDGEGNPIDKIQHRVEGLAKQAIENKSLLRRELHWLATAEAQEGHRFGYELGKRDRDFSLLPELIEPQRATGEGASAAFLGGYLRALFEADKESWEQQLDAIGKDRDLRHWLPELTWRSGESDQAYLRLLDLAQKGHVDVTQPRLSFFGGTGISKEIFREWIEFLMDLSEAHAAFTAVHWYHIYYLREDSKHVLPETLSLQLLTHEVFFSKDEGYEPSLVDEYLWTDIGKRFVRHYPKSILPIADKILEHLGEENTIFGRSHSQVLGLLCEIAMQNPAEVWQRVTSYLGPPIDSRALHIKTWLHEREGDSPDEDAEGALSIFPLEKIWEWVDEDIEKRAWYLANFVPKKLFREADRICLAREVLVKYGTREDVRSELAGNLSSSGFFWGPESLRHQEMKEALLDFQKEEDDRNVKRWIDEYISSLDRQIEQAKVREERRDP